MRRTARRSPTWPRYPDFVAQADHLVRMIEADNARKTNLLRMSQAALAAIACMGTVAVIYLLYLRIILPVLTLQDGLRRMADREFSLRLPVTSRDEFRRMSTGFNRAPWPPNSRNSTGARGPRGPEDRRTGPAHSRP